MTTQDLAAQIKKTGFVLENRIAQLLKASKWTVISNRYYVDDAEESVREIDLVAYQISKVQHLDVYTTLIISCKKSDANSWALLAREVNLKDPNSDWQPLHAWSNDKAINYQLSTANASKRYHGEAARIGAGEALGTPAVEVFAFQEMSKSNGSPQNDKNIFAAVTSLMKAQAYEMGSLPQRKKSPAVYQFNLLSIVDTDLVRLMFQGDAIEPTAVDTEHYIARYIIKKRETFSRVRFIRANCFAGVLTEYSKLHLANCHWFHAECDSFYRDILKDRARCNVLLEAFQKEIRWTLHGPLVTMNIKAPEPASIYMTWSDQKNVALISGIFGAEGARLLNTDESVRRRISKSLQKIYRYQGGFEFEDDEFPF